MKNPFLRFILWGVSLVFTGTLLGIAAVGAVLYHFSLDLPDFGKLAHYNPPTVTRLYSADDKLLAEYATEKRVYVPLSAVPKRVIQAFVSAEDKDFYTNNGIDVYGIGRAVLQNLRNLLANGHGNVSGGSTITQQVVKNFLLTPEKSFTRKIKEMILAFRITQVYSKDRIMELYLNEIYLGKGSYGVAEAALNYFNKSLDELTIEEAAFLAALPQRPTRHEGVKDRRDWVINRMMYNNYITADEARSAIAIPITLRVRDKTEMTRADFFAEEVRRELAAKYGDDMLYNGGLFVKTTLDPQLQEYAEKSLRLALREYDHRHGYRGPLLHLTTLENWPKQLATFETQKRLPLFDDEQLAVVTETRAGKASIDLMDGKHSTIDKATVTWAAQKQKLEMGDVIIVAPSEKNQFTIHQIPLVNGAMIAMDPHTGRVLAMAGGYSSAATEFNRATQAKRQPGSAFKPFVYLAAMENGFTPSSIVVDAPVELSQGNGLPVWRPNNYSDEYLGPATLRTGLEKSRNAMTVRLAQMLGIDKIIEVGKRFGIYDSLPREFSIVLGAEETTLIRLANAYAMIDNGGKKISPWLIERIDDRNGKTILRRDARACIGCNLDAVTLPMPSVPPIPADDRAQIVDPQVDYQIVSMLEGVTIRGTGARARVIGKPVAGKTGTTNDSRDTWFMGFSPDLVAGIYVGYDQPQTLGKKETGASVALPGFISFMQDALKDKPSKPFRIPPGMEFIRVDAKTGQPPLPGSPDPVIMEAFKSGEGPESNAAPMPPGQQGPMPQYEFPSESPPPLPGTPGYQMAPTPPPAHYENGGQGTGGLY